MSNLVGFVFTLLVLLLSSVSCPGDAQAQVAAVDQTSATRAAALPSWREQLTGMVFVQLPKGCFQMGNRRPVAYVESYPGHPLTASKFQFVDELPQHEVCLDAFWIGKYEVRADEWHRVMGGVASHADLPVTGVSWDEAQRFATQLGQLADGQGHFRLPTEAEWEYACRAGARQDVVVTYENPLESAWYATAGPEMKGQEQAVGQLPANAFGLHDMLGNVWEWVQDAYQSDAYKNHTLFNPQVPGVGGERVIRGASYRSEPLHVRCAKRGFYVANQSLGSIGLRLVRVP